MNDLLSDKIISYIEENRVSTTEVADCLGKSIGIAPTEATSLSRGHFVVGKVKYLYAIGQSNWYIHEEMALNPVSGCIIYMDAIDVDGRAIVGDLVSKYFLLYLRNKAIVTNGKMRDAHRLIKENYPIWCGGVSPRGCFNTKPDIECDSMFRELIEINKEKYDGTIAVCDDSGVVIIPKECITEDFYEKLNKIEEKEDIWYDCINRKKWSTFETICLKRYLESEGD